MQPGRALCEFFGKEKFGFSKSESWNISVIQEEASFTCDIISLNNDGLLRTVSEELHRKA